MRKSLKIKQELTKILANAISDARYLVEDYISDSQSYEDFEDRMDVCDEVLLSLSNDFETITDVVFEQYKDTFIPQEVNVASLFQSVYLPTSYFANPSVFAGQLVESDMHKYLLDNFKTVTKEENFDADFLDDAVASQLHKFDDYNILEIDFNFENFPNSRLLYKKAFLPYRITPDSFIQIAVPFFTTLSKDKKTTSLYYYDSEWESEDSLSTTPFLHSRYSSSEDDLDKLKEILQQEPDTIKTTAFA